MNNPFVHYLQLCHVVRYESLCFVIVCFELRRIKKRNKINKKKEKREKESKIKLPFNEFSWN